MDEIIHTICIVIPSINWTAVILSVVYLHYGYKIIRLNLEVCCNHLMLY